MKPFLEGKRRKNALRHLLLGVLCLCALAPLGLLVLLSLRGGRGYAMLFAKGSSFLRAYGNSLFVCGLCLAGQLLTSVLGGWGLAKHRFPGCRALLFACIVLMLLPVQALLLPQYLLLQGWGLLDTPWALVLPGVFSPLGTVLLWHGFSSFPNSLVEAAACDGAGWLTTLWHIVLPECKRELAALLLISLAESWSMLEQPMAYLRSAEQYPLSVYLSTAAIADPAQRAAACVAALAPLLGLFCLLSRRLFPARG